MTDINKLENEIKQIIDELKGLCSQNGLSNQASEEVVITSVFLYKFLNDRFMFNLKKFAEEIGMEVEEVLKNENNELDAFYDSYPQEVAFSYEDTIEYLSNRTMQDDFADQFDNALLRISDNTRNSDFSIETAEGKKKPLFTKITEFVDDGKRNNFTASIFNIITTKRFDFGEAFNENFDFYSTIFEYLIKDYNVASGRYAEYFTPQAVSSIIGNILVNMSPLTKSKYDIYDPSAGSGSLILHLANALGKGNFGDKATVYTQDISQKSSRFLRINMLLNGFKSSLHNIVEGDTLLTPAHYKIAGDSNSGIKLFDFITSNPPFKMDFSSTSGTIERKWEKAEEHDGLKRFFAGVPKVPKKKREAMPIYVCFIQHILWSLKSDGKAAIVVPTGFLTAKNGIEYEVRKTIIDKHWLKGAISMPSNIFANTGTNVSILFIDKSNKEGEILLMDASKLGTKVKDGKNQKTLLSTEDIQKIESTFIKQLEEDDFSVKTNYNKITEKGYSLAAGQYFEIPINHIEISPEEFTSKINAHKTNLNTFFNKQHELEKEIIKQIGGLNI